MTTLKNIEFYTDPYNNVLIADGNGVRTYTFEDHDITAMMFARIEEDYPEAFKALTEFYQRSIPNVPYFRWLVVCRFIRCNFSLYDRKTDIDACGVFQLEEVQCPLRGECKLDGVVCRAKLNNKLTARQEEVMRHYCEGLTYQEIAERLYISPETVKTIKRDAFRKVGVHDINEFRNKVKL
jgi:DNA-binding CsgD family transcriptional regulator